MINGLLCNAHNKGLLTNLVLAKQKKFKKFLPDKTIAEEEVCKYLQVEQPLLYSQFVQWRQDKTVDTLKTLYKTIMQNRLNSKHNFIRRNVLYLYVMERMKSTPVSEEEQDWIERELFTLCMYTPFENVYLSFMIWRIKLALYNIRHGSTMDIRLYLKENKHQVEDEFLRVKQKFCKLHQLAAFFTDDAFYWLKAELLILDVVFDSCYSHFSIMEKLQLAYQFYRTYHSTAYHIKCGDSLFKILLLLNDKLDFSELCEVYNMILICYNKCITEKYQHVSKSCIDFQTFVHETPQLNISTYETVIDRLYAITNSTEVKQCYDKFLNQTQAQL